MSEAVKVGLIGCGNRARKHIPGLKAEARCRVVGMADIKQASAQALKDDFELEGEVYTDYAKLLADHELDLVITCLWTPLHVPVFKACVEAGVRAVQSEKPMAPTLGECRAMSRLAETSGCQLTFCHQRRFCKGNRLVRRLVEEGAFGEIQRMDLYSPPNLLDCGTHTFDQALSFNRETPARWVLGALDLSRPLKWFNVRAEGMASGLVVFENGVRATIQVGGEDKDMGAGVRVHGSEGFIEAGWDGQIGRAVRYDDPAWSPPTEDERESGAGAAAAEGEDPDANAPSTVMADVVRDLIDSLESGREPELHHRKALRASEIIFALYESARSHARVELPMEYEGNACLDLIEERLPEDDGT